VLRRRANDDLERRLRRFERRLEDVEDALAAALAPDRVDDLGHRVETLSVTAVSHDDLLHVRMDVARLAAELTRVRAELQAELDQLTGAVLDARDPGFPRRASGY
jgi:predicted  nucleic acid-binding Zn-ribbon protein